MYVPPTNRLRQPAPTVLVRNVNRNSPDYIRWTQRSLNKILRLNLMTDGVIGRQTRSAIRSFQQKQRLPTTGAVDLKTEEALVTASGEAVPGTIAGPIKKQANATLHRFDKNSAKLKEFHTPEIDRIADEIVSSWQTGPPIVTVYVKGHTSSEGPAQYNIGLGTGRALAVRKALQKALERKQKNLSYKVLILTQSKGAKEPVDTNETEEGKSQNRRVEVFLSTTQLKPLPQKPKESGYPQICVSPGELIFVATAGESSQTRFIELSRCGGYLGIEWSAVVPKNDWLQVTPLNGFLSKSSAKVIVTVSPGIAGIGKHIATLTFKGVTSIGTSEPGTLTIQLYVNKQPDTIGPSPSTLPGAGPSPLCLGGSIFCQTLKFMRDKGGQFLLLSNSDRQRAVQIEHSLLMKYCAHTRPLGGTPIPSGSDVTAPERQQWVQRMFRQATERVDAVIQRSPAGPPIC